MTRLRDLALPSALAVAVAITVFLSLLLLGLKRYTVATISMGMLFVGIPLCQHLLSRRTARRRVVVDGPPTLAAYSMGPVNLFLLGTLWLLGVSVLVNSLNGLAMGGAEVEFGAGIAASGPIILIILGWTAFCVGQWVGRRAKRWAVRIGSSIVVAVELISSVSDYILAPADAYLSAVGLPRRPTSVLLKACIGTITLLLPAMLGVWRGTRAKPRAYMNYILELLPGETQRLLVDMAREEVHRVALAPAYQLPEPSVAPTAQSPASGPSGWADAVAAIARPQWFRPVAVPLLSFLAGVASILVTQTVASREQSAHARRENRVVALRDYATACESTVVSIAQLANLPLHFAGIEIDNDSSREKQTDREYQLYDEANVVWRKDLAQLAVQRDIVNALFRTKVDPFVTNEKNLPPEINLLPGGFDVDKLMKGIKADPLVALKKYSPVLGQMSKDLSSYCSESVQTLSKEIE